MDASARAPSPRRVGPVRAAVSALARAAPWLAPALERALWRGFYELASFGGRSEVAALMNYGYAPPGENGAGDGADRFGLALYGAVAGGAELAGRDVLEVGCGRGGGAAFVYERFRPRSLTGLDLARTAVRRASRRYGRPGLEFRCGDAQSLPFPPARFDAVLNVESSHCYPDVGAFLGEVARVLRPGGTLLLADFRPALAGGSPGKDDLQKLRDQIAAAGMEITEEHDITAEVVRALTLATPVVRERVRRRVPGPLRRHAMEFSGVEGSAIFRSLEERSLRYVRLVAERPQA